MSSHKEELSSTSKFYARTSYNHTPTNKIFISNSLKQQSPGPTSKPKPATIASFECDCRLDRQFMCLDITMKEQCISKLKEDLRKTITDLSTLESKYAKLKRTCRSMQDKLILTTDELQSAKTQNGELQKSKKDILERSCQLEFALATERSKLEEATKELVLLREQKNGLDIENIQLTNQLNYLKQEVLKVTKRETCTLNRLQQLYEQLTTIKPYKEKYEQLVAKQKQMSDSLEGLKTANKSLSVQLQQKQQTISTLRSRLNEQSNRQIESKKSLQKQNEKNKQLTEQIKQLSEEFKLENNALQTQVNYFREVCEQIYKQQEKQISNAKQRFHTREVLETNMQTSRLLTHGNKQHNSPNKENRRPNESDPPNIRVIESCPTDEDHMERRVGSIKGLLRGNKRTPLRVHNQQE